jgi:hypothetical protein
MPKQEMTLKNFAIISIVVVFFMLACLLAGLHYLQATWSFKCCFQLEPFARV